MHWHIEQVIYDVVIASFSFIFVEFRPVGLLVYTICLLLSIQLGKDTMKYKMLCDFWPDISFSTILIQV